ncbi:MAG: hypothetical protein DMF50_00335, partial [Acidobacteria bacterium]
IQLGADGTMYVAGDTTSPNFPGATNALAGGRDAFLAVLAPDGTVERSTLVGGTSHETLASLSRIDDSTFVLVGTTESADFPIRQEGPSPVPQAAYGGGASDAFIAEVRDGSLVRSTFWGGSGADRVSDATLSLTDEAATVATGWTDSADFPVVHPVQPGAAVVPPQGFLLKLVHDARKDRVAISTYLYETGGAVAADPSGAIYFSGPNTLVGKLNPVGHLEYLAHGTSGAAMALSGSQRVAVAGAIRDFSLPTFGAYRAYSDGVFVSAGAGNGDGFVSILAEGPNLDATREQDDAAVTYTGTWPARRTAVARRSNPRRPAPPRPSGSRGPASRSSASEARDRGFCATRCSTRPVVGRPSGHPISSGESSRAGGWTPTPPRKRRARS